MINKLTKLFPVFYKEISTPNVRGRSYGLWIVIEPHLIDDKGLLAHERCHVRQFITTLGTHGIMYMLSKKYKYKAEVEAFGYSIAYGSRTISDVKNSLISAYGITNDIMDTYEADIEFAIYKAKQDIEELI
jgi:hypothetical protein